MWSSEKSLHLSWQIPSRLQHRYPLINALGVEPSHKKDNLNQTFFKKDSDSERYALTLIKNSSGRIQFVGLPASRRAGRLGRAQEREKPNLDVTIPDSAASHSPLVCSGNTPTHKETHPQLNCVFSSSSLPLANRHEGLSPV